jgi:excinuclease ABC subunit A
VVFSGVSGSGKSSLAFDTIFAEGQRRYLDCLSGSTSWVLDRVARPDVDRISGLPPTVAIDQRSGQASPRSTLGTLTEINDSLRLLFARLGTPHCPRCDRPIDRQTPEQMAGRVMGLPPGTRVLILAPLVRNRKGEHADAFQAIRRAGLIRARVDGQTVEVSDGPPKLARSKSHSIEAVVDRLVVRDGIQPRLFESLALAIKLADGLVVVSSEGPDGWSDRLMSVHFSCPECGEDLPVLEPRHFSFNTPEGACPVCQGLGSVVVEPGPEKPSSAKEKPDLAVEESRGRKVSRSRPAGERRPCPECGGTRLRPEARAVRIQGRSLPELAAMVLPSLRETLAGFHFDPTQEAVAGPLVAAVTGRLNYLKDVGLDYLTLDRATDTLSGGELQRARLATQLGSGLVGVCFVLDEPTAGLHPRDTDRLIACLRRLQSRGNSVIVVEHDEAVIRDADWVIDIGPGPGPLGGRVVAQATPAGLIEAPGSVTGPYLRPEHPRLAPSSQPLLPDHSPGWLLIQNARGRNLKGDDVRIPMGALTCVTGVSGSGKSTLVHEVLAQEFRRRQAAKEVAASRPSGETGSALISGWEAIDQLIEVDQSPIGRTPRSTPATYTGVFAALRRVFASTREAKIRGYGPRRFSFNEKGGRCETCEGQGFQRIPMRFLPDLYAPCETCRGKRFNRQTLEITFKGKSIADVLETRVDEALALFDAQPKVRPGLAALQSVGLGYVTLGQSSTTLSGGESQRVKLAAELCRRRPGPTLHILDEPTTGLHFTDIARLRDVLAQLVELGDTVIVIEHNLDVIASADWVVDLGPEAGEAGGAIVAQGTPQDVARSGQGWTARYLQRLFGF